MIDLNIQNENILDHNDLNHMQRLTILTVLDKVTKYSKILKIGKSALDEVHLSFDNGMVQRNLNR